VASRIAHALLAALLHFRQMELTDNIIDIFLLASILKSYIFYYMD